MPALGAGMPSASISSRLTLGSDRPGGTAKSRDPGIPAITGIADTDLRRAKRMLAVAGFPTAGLWIAALPAECRAATGSLSTEGFSAPANPLVRSGGSLYLRALTFASESPALAVVSSRLGRSIKKPPGPSRWMHWLFSAPQP